MSENTIIYQCDFNSSIPGGPVTQAIDDSRWAGGQADLRIIDSGDPARGNQLEARVSGFCQIAFGHFDVRPGAAYRVSITLSARGTQTVDVELRKGPEPYTVHGSIRQQVFESPRRLSFLVREAKPANPVRVQIIMRGFTTLTIDDVLVEEVTGDLPPANSEDPLAMLLPDPEWPHGNLLANSSFEVGIDGWYPYRGAWGAWAPEPSNDAYDGRYVLRMKKNFGTATPFIHLPLRGESIIIARVKAVGGPAEGAIGFGNYIDFFGGDQFPSREFSVAPEEGWKRVETSFRPRCPNGQLEPWLQFYGTIDCTKGELLVDAVAVRHLGESMDAADAPFAPRAALEFAIRTDMPFGVATQGERVAATLFSSQPDAHCRMRMLDEEGRETGAWDVKTVDGRAKIDLGTPDCGAWRLTTAAGASAAHEGAQAPGRIDGESFLLVVPPMPDVPLAKWPFGGHIREDADLRSACWKLGWRWTRQHDGATYGKWAQVQPRSADDWNFDPQQWQFLRSAGHAVLTNIDDIPGWAPKKEARRGGSFDLFTDATSPAFREFCRRLAVDAKGLADEYEICNEVTLSGIPAADYLAILRTAHDGLKSGDPDAHIVGLGGAVPQESPWMYRCIELGVGKWCDAISFHGYGFTNNAQNRGPEPLIECVKRIRAALSAAGTPHVRVYDTESGFIIRSSLTKHNMPLGDAQPDEAGGALTKAVAAVVASGLDRWFYYGCFDQTAPGQGAAFCAAEVGRLMKPSYQPMAVAISLLTGLIYKGRKHAEDGVVHLMFSGRGKMVHMLWSPDGRARVTIPEGTETVLNMWGRSLTKANEMTVAASPVYCLVGM